MKKLTTIVFLSLTTISTYSIAAKDRCIDGSQGHRNNASLSMNEGCVSTDAKNSNSKAEKMKIKAKRMSAKKAKKAKKAQKRLEKKARKDSRISAKKAKRAQKRLEKKARKDSRIEKQKIKKQKNLRDKKKNRKK